MQRRVATGQFVTDNEMESYLDHCSTKTSSRFENMAKEVCTIGATDDFGFNAIQDKVHVNDLHATILGLLGIDHEELTFFFQGRIRRLTDVAAKTI